MIKIVVKIIIIQVYDNGLFLYRSVHFKVIRLPLF